MGPPAELQFGRGELEIRSLSIKDLGRGRIARLARCLGELRQRLSSIRYKFAVHGNHHSYFLFLFVASIFVIDAAECDASSPTIRARKGCCKSQNLARAPAQRSWLYPHSI